jgi:glycerophosphoryl diester phosphodiesterase
VLLTLLENIINILFASTPRKKPLYNDIQNASLIAHRGAHHNRKGIIENTVEAFKLAREAGCWGIEFDVHATADNVLVVNHDSTLKRLWGHNVAIANVTFKELRSLEPRIPSLKEVAAEFYNMHLFIELKAPFRDEHALIEALQNVSPIKDYHLLALDAPTFVSLSKFPKQSLLLVAVHNNVKEFCDLSISKNYGGVLGNYLLLTNSVKQQLKDANQLYGVGFVDSKNSLYRELNRGIMWIFTNQAELVGKHLQRMR